MRLRIGAMVLGFVGGIVGFVIGNSALMVGIMLQSELGEFLGVGGLGAGLIAFLPISIMGVIGAAITLAKPRAAGILMLLSAIFMFITGIVVGAEAGFSMENVGLGIIPTMFSGILLIIAGIIALIAREEEI